MGYGLKSSKKIRAAQFCEENCAKYTCQSEFCTQVHEASTEEAHCNVAGQKLTEAKTG